MVITTNNDSKYVHISYSYNPEKHYIQRTGGPPAVVLTDNNGIIFDQFNYGQAASGESSQTLMMSCIAGLISGASSIINAHLYSTCLKPELVDQVTVQLTADDILEAHAQDEICIHENTRANPLQVAGSSAFAFFCLCIIFHDFYFSQSRTIPLNWGYDDEHCW